MNLLYFVRMNLCTNSQFIPVSQLLRCMLNTLMLYLHISISNYNFPDTFSRHPTRSYPCPVTLVSLKLFMITQTKS